MMTPDELARELISVQPMPSDAIKNLYEASMKEQDLIKEGYEPVEKNGFSLMWIKQDKE